MFVYLQAEVPLERRGKKDRLTKLSYNLHVVYLVSLKVLKVKNNVRYHCYKFSNDDDDSDEEKENDNDNDA